MANCIAASMAVPSPSLPGAVDDVDVGQRLGELVGDPARAVGRVVVDDQDRRMRRVLADLRHERPQIVGLVVGGQRHQQPRGGRCGRGMGWSRPALSLRVSRGRDTGVPRALLVRDWEGLPSSPPGGRRQGGSFAREGAGHRMRMTPDVTGVRWIGGGEGEMRRRRPRRWWVGEQGRLEGRKAGADSERSRPARRGAVRHRLTAMNVPPGEEGRQEHQDPRRRHLLVVKTDYDRHAGLWPVAGR